MSACECALAVDSLPRAQRWWVCLWHSLNGGMATSSGGCALVVVWSVQGGGASVQAGVYGALRIRRPGQVPRGASPSKFSHSPSQFAAWVGGRLVADRHWWVTVVSGRPMPTRSTCFVNMRTTPCPSSSSTGYVTDSVEVALTAIDSQMAVVMLTVGHTYTCMRAEWTTGGEAEGSGSAQATGTHCQACTGGHQEKVRAVTEDMCLYVSLCLNRSMCVTPTNACVYRKQTNPA